MSLRNTRTHRLCPTCRGFGEITLNTSALQDPQCDEPGPCPEPRCERGWVRFAPVDPLDLVAHARRFYLRGHRAPTLGQQYREARIRAFRPVRLPDHWRSRWEREIGRDTVAAIENFRAFDSQFGAFFGARLAQGMAS